MRFLSFVTATLAVLGTSFAQQTIRTHDTCAFIGQECARHDFVKVDKYDGPLSVYVAVAHKEGAAAQCDSLLYEISDPQSPSYGKHLSLEEVGALMSDKATTKKVMYYLTENGIPKESMEPTINGDFIKITADASLIENVFSADFYNFRSAKKAKTIQRSHSYTIPKELVGSIDYVGGIVRFPNLHGYVFSPKTPNQGGNTTPSLLSSYYNISSNTVGSSSATQSVLESLGQSYSPDDLSQFQSNFNLPNQPVTKVIGPNNPNSCSYDPNNCAEASLDVQYIMAVSQGSPTTFWSVSTSNDFFSEWITNLSNDNNPPLVHSISYGSIGPEESPSDETRFSVDACKLGLRGLTILVSSGDDGVANFQARSDPSQCGFVPSFPATVPYITAVGATQGPEYGQTEVACSSSTGGLITTGGGFSQFFTRPAYQSRVVSSYLNNAPALPPRNLFASNGRGYPDVSALGHNYEVYIAGSVEIVSGTSASAPVFAGMVSLVNGMRLNAGKKPLGFLNPALYQLPRSAFNDITQGRNNCCAGQPGSQVCCQYGFNATVGWDPLTGLGSPNFAVFSNALANL